MLKDESLLSGSFGDLWFQSRDGSVAGDVQLLGTIQDDTQKACDRMWAEITLLELAPGAPSRIRGMTSDMVMDRLDLEPRDI